MNLRMRNPRFEITAAAALSLIAGCAATRLAPSHAPTVKSADDAITHYYEEATRTHVRSIRKPLRDERSRAMRALEHEANSILRASDRGSTESLLAADSDRPSEGALTEYRESLLAIARAANADDVAELRDAYVRYVEARDQLRSFGLNVE